MGQVQRARVLTLWHRDSSRWPHSTLNRCTSFLESTVTDHMLCPSPMSIVGGGRMSSTGACSGLTDSTSAWSCWWRSPRSIGCPYTTVPGCPTKTRRCAGSSVLSHACNTTPPVTVIQAHAHMLQPICRDRPARTLFGEAHRSHLYNGVQQQEHERC